MKSLRVLIVDDSATVREGLAALVAAEPDMTVMAVASDPYFAVEKIKAEVPDVIICDIEMPRMDGITFVQKIMLQRPIPVVICSSLAEAGSETAMRALEAGAVEIIAKPRLRTREFLEEAKAVVCDAIRAAARAKLKPRQPRTLHPEKKLTADAVLAAPTGKPLLRTTDRVVVIGASTGGTEALRHLLEHMPADAPGIVIVQHMPAGFTTAFAKRLDQSCRIEVREAKDHDRVLPGLALIAPGDHHLLLHRSGAQYLVEVRNGPLVSRHRPSVDVLFRSTAQAAGRNALGVILTGMGDDGARGLMEMREAGATTLGQDEASCIVYGMPKEAMRLGAVQHELPLARLPSEIIRFAHAGEPRATTRSSV